MSMELYNACYEGINTVIQPKDKGADKIVMWPWDCLHLFHIDALFTGLTFRVNNVPGIWNQHADVNEIIQCLLCKGQRTNVLIKLDESTTGQHQKSPQSLSSRSWHLIFVTKRSQSWSGMTTNSHPFCSMSDDPPIPEICVFQNLAKKSMVKTMCVIKGEGHIVGLATDWFTYFSFDINHLWHPWDTAISNIHLEYPRSKY